MRCEDVRGVMFMNLATRYMYQASCVFACLESRDYRYYHMFQMAQIAQSARTGKRPSWYDVDDRGRLIIDSAIMVSTPLN